MTAMRVLRGGALTAVLVIGGCGSHNGNATCATDAGARVCMTSTSRASSYRLALTGFQPNSDLQMTRSGAAEAAATIPKAMHVGPEGTASGQLGLTPGPPGPTTVMFAGRAATGAAVSLRLVVSP